MKKNLKKKTFMSKYHIFQGVKFFFSDLSVRTVPTKCALKLVLKVLFEQKKMVKISFKLFSFVLEKNWVQKFNLKKVCIYLGCVSQKGRFNFEPREDNWKKGIPRVLFLNQTCRNPFQWPVRNPLPQLLGKYVRGNCDYKKKVTSKVKQ